MWTHRAIAWLLPLLGALTLACGSSDGDEPSGHGGGGAMTSTGGGGGGAEGPPFEVGPKRYGTYQAFDTQVALDCAVPLSFVFYEPLGSGSCSAGASQPCYPMNSPPAEGCRWGEQSCTAGRCPSSCISTSACAPTGTSRRSTTPRSRCWSASRRWCRAERPRPKGVTRSRAI